MLTKKDIGKRVVRGGAWPINGILTGFNSNGHALIDNAPGRWNATDVYGKWKVYPVKQDNKEKVQKPKELETFFILWCEGPELQPPTHKFKTQIDAERTGAEMAKRFNRVFNVLRVVSAIKPISKTRIVKPS